MAIPLHNLSNAYDSVLQTPLAEMTDTRSTTARSVVRFLTEPPANYEILNSGLGGGSLVPRPKSRGKPLMPAQPLSQFVKDCLEFLSRVDTVQVVGGTKKEFQVRLVVRSRSDETKTVSFDITRTSDEIFALQHDVLEACRQHPFSSTTGLEPCALCEQLKILPPLPKSTERLFSSKTAIHKTIQDRLSLFVAGALVPPTNTNYFCEGQVSVPVAVRRFLLRGVDDIMALK
jgi:hypothetical protein